MLSEAPASHEPFLRLHPVQQIAVLYTGITDDLYRRAREHKNNVHPGFTRDYRVHRLVYYETFKYVNNAVAREKSIKGWLRRKKDCAD